MKEMEELLTAENCGGEAVVRRTAKTKQAFYLWDNICFLFVKVPCGVFGHWQR